MTIEEQLEQAQAQVVALTAERDAVRADLDAARVTCTAAITDRDRLARQVADHDAAMAAVTAERDGFRAQVDGFEATRVEDANKAAVAMLAKSGHPSVSVSVDTPTPASKPDLSNLTGLEKAIAAHSSSK